MTSLVVVVVVVVSLCYTIHNLQNLGEGNDDLKVTKFYLVP